MRRRGLTVGVFGARGVVGRETLALLQSRRFPVARLRAFGARAGTVRFRGRSVRVEPLRGRSADFDGLDLALLAVEADVAEALAPRLLAAGALVVDESSAFRMDPKVPLVIPEINGDLLKKGTRLVAGPNCTTAALLMGLYPLHRSAGLTELRVATYQAVSGAGRAAVEEFLGQVRSRVRGRRPASPKAQPRLLAFNVFPQIGSFGADGETGEEAKIAAESRKILSAPGLKVSATAVRVPVLRGHSMAAWVKTRRPLSPAQARRLLEKAPGVELRARDERYPTPLDADGRGPVLVGRVRRGLAGELSLWITGDNLLKGAALNSVQIAEACLKKGLLGS